MIDLATKTRAASIAVRYQQAPALISKTIVPIMRRIGADLVKHSVREKLSGQVLNRRTSTLSRAVFYRMFLDQGDKDVVLVFGADAAKAPYARVHEFGGTIRPKSSTFLTIPLGPAKTARGVARVSAREFIANPGALGFESTFVNKARTAIMGTRDGIAEPVFALKREITLPERSYLRATVTDRRAWIREELGLGTAQAVNELQ